MRLKNPCGGPFHSAGGTWGGPYKRNQNPYKSDKFAPYIRYMTEIEKIEKELEMSKDRH